LLRIIYFTGLRQANLIYYDCITESLDGIGWNVEKGKAGLPVEASA
jgi:hypothetical protein